MRAGGLLLAGLLVALTSCGLETVSSLPAPNVTYSDQDLFVSMSMVHESNRYTDTDFQGYEIYYKIYPVSTSSEWSNLITDRDRLATSPTVSRLSTALGYSRLSVVAQSSAGFESGREELLATPGDGQTMTLDFQAFLQAGASDRDQWDSKPVLRYDDSLAAKPYLYRTVTLVDDIRYFGSLRTASAKALDMASWTASAGNHYEVDVFLVAYGLTSTLETVYSKPVPWGVIHTIE